jgi:hypothetical protein
MKSISRFAWVILVVTMSSFTFNLGGESYTIHLNNKLLVEHYLTSKAVTPSFSLDQAGANDELSIYYNECGKIGKERKLTIKDEQDNVLKTWSFTNTIGEHTPMICKAKDIIALKQNERNTLKLYYSSKEVSSERFLAIIMVESTFSQEVKN